jgi:ankyrin repeat protein
MATATNLHEACGSGNVTRVHVLLMSHADMNAVDSGGSTSLHWAAGNNHKDVLAVLFGFGCPTDHANNVSALQC